MRRTRKWSAARIASEFHNEGIDQIETIEVRTARLLKLRATWNGPAQMVLRNGPALVVHTPW